MTLNEYCAVERGRRRRLAEKTLICDVNIDKIKRGEKCSLRNALLIEKHTGGQVLAISLPVSKLDRLLLAEYKGVA